ncbi:hypothetical protein I0C86_11275 [Plantactinospora sp. S1510]|uniref:Uncharacterized protein n=1 Tax=Plantactinospora alkalitolerans TaxID=2789879 RepID=A0ABS0GTM6_9ACTN|nr:hypothetical protein [Plantactinospora alkalitolerans]MBF9129542.1 hypothetical protein [Plantactinospora alkalitolerans]
MDRPVPAVALLLGVAFGLFAGIGYAVARRAWTDYRKTKATLPGMRSAAWAVTRIATSRAGIVLLLCLAAVGWAAAGGER